VTGPVPDVPMPCDDALHGEVDSFQSPFQSTFSLERSTEKSSPFGAMGEAVQAAVTAGVGNVILGSDRVGNVSENVGVGISVGVGAFFEVVKGGSSGGSHKFGGTQVHPAGQHASGIFLHILSPATEHWPEDCPSHSSPSGQHITLPVFDESQKVPTGQQPGLGPEQQKPPDAQGTLPHDARWTRNASNGLEVALLKDLAASFTCPLV